MQFGTNYSDTLNLVYLDFLSFQVKFGNHWRGPNFEVRLGCNFDVQIVPGFLFRRFWGNLRSKGKMLL